jgi:hypothetical protein
VRPSISTLTGAFGVVPVALATCDEVQELPLRALRVYLVLLSRFNAKRDGWSWSKAAFARDTGVHRDHIGEVIKRLEASGLLAVERGHGLVSSHYRLTVPPSLTVGEGASLAPTVGAGLAPSPMHATPELAPRVGADLAPRVGASLAPTLHRDHTEVTTEPPYPHSEQNRAEPKNPLAPCKQGEPIRSSVEGESQEYRLPEAMLRRTRAPKQAGLRERLRQDVVPDPPEVIPPDPVEYEGELTRGDLVRQVARDLGVRLREARRIVERREIISAQDVEPPPPLMVERQHLEEMRALGWLMPGMEEACAGRIIENGYTPVVA